MGMLMRVTAAAFAAAAGLVATTAASADVGPTLAGEQIASFFQPCQTAPVGPGGSHVCVSPLQPAKVQAQCNPNGSSTLTLSTTGFAIGPFPGTAEVQLTIQIGPQVGAEVPAFHPFPNFGIEAGTLGFAAGPVTTWTEHFRITAADGTVVDGTKTLTGTSVTSGVCQELNNQPVPSSRFPNTPPSTAYFYLANAQNLGYRATIDSPVFGHYTDGGLADAYLANSYGTCCGGTIVITSQGSFVQQFTVSTGPLADAPGKGCGDKNHVHERENECKNPAK